MSKEVAPKKKATPKKPRPQAEVLEYDVDPGASAPPKKKASERRKSSGQRAVEVIDYGVEPASHG